MGLNINGTVVEVDHTHNRLMSTGTSGNPSIKHVPNLNSRLAVYSVFQRHKSPASANRHRQPSLGDNCHLLYALKGKDGLTTTFGDIKRLMLNFDTILESIADISQEYDLVVPMPSRHSVSRIFGTRLARRFQCDISVNLFSKITIEAAHEMLIDANLKTADRKSVELRLKKQSAGGQIEFSLKDIPVQFRHFFPPITMKSEGLTKSYVKILLADDLLSTGTTLLEAQRLITQAQPDAVVDAACLFSAV